MEYAGKVEFWDGLIQNLQTDSTLTSTACIKMLHSFSSVTTNIQNYGNNQNIYKKEIIAKGKANGGTDVGFWINKITKYSDIAVKFFDVYNSCKIDYYLISLGTQLTTVTGATGFVTNIAGLLLADLAGTGSVSNTVTAGTNAGNSVSFSELNNALGTHNALKVGQFVGRFIGKIVTVEIPTYSTQTKQQFPYTVSGQL